MHLSYWSLSAMRGGNGAPGIAVGEIGPRVRTVAPELSPPNCPPPNCPPELLPTGLSPHSRFPTARLPGATRRFRRGAHDQNDGAEDGHQAEVHAVYLPGRVEMHKRVLADMRSGRQSRERRERNRAEHAGEMLSWIRIEDRIAGQTVSDRRSWSTWCFRSASRCSRETIRWVREMLPTPPTCPPGRGRMGVPVAHRVEVTTGLQPRVDGDTLLYIQQRVGVTNQKAFHRRVADRLEAPQQPPVTGLPRSKIFAEVALRVSPDR